MNRNGRCVLTISVRPSVYAAVNRLAAKLHESKQALCERAIESAVEWEIERTATVRATSPTLAEAGLAELDNVAPRPHWIKKPE